MHVPPRAKNPTAEDFEYCRGEFKKLSRKLAKGDFNSSDREEMLFDALEYGKTVVQYAIELQNKHVSESHQNETDSSSDGKFSDGGVPLPSKIARVSVSKKRARSDDTSSEDEDDSKSLKKVRMTTTKKRTRDAVEDSSDDGQTSRSSKKARLGGEKVEAARVFKELDALLKTSVKGSK
ncbi:hypothetical protein PV05_06953 [Exophiala xenobiotica]|uniref:Uncharacterized protein n=1 Tax=Exophiala xenobiotica TaxID=348802 RepID=A0A0D2F3Y7_9EURO|nr:uncharacterized protein PV05_06953 [Exophiala xenobiotica]KIW54604.1 hypothetical protein PV05_06953 [Exophiala xenobiotica]